MTTGKVIADYVVLMEFKADTSVRSVAERGILGLVQDYLAALTGLYSS
jgi:hypothetical protein